MKSLQDYKKAFREKFAIMTVNGEFEYWRTTTDNDGDLVYPEPSEVWKFIEGMAREMLEDAFDVIVIIKEEDEEIVSAIREKIQKHKLLILGEQKGEEDEKQNI